MTNRPIPRRGLLGCWFLDDRGITYDAGQNQAIDRSGRGNHATYKNGVTVGAAGDPSRAFGAAAFDASRNQSADVGVPLAVDGAHAVVAICQSSTENGEDFVVAATDDASNGYVLRLINNKFSFDQRDSSSDESSVRFEYTPDKYACIVGFFDGEQIGLFVNGTLVESKSISSQAPSDADLVIGNQEEFNNPFEGEIAAVGRYDLTVPNAPEPSEIAERWDRLTDIPATR